MLHVMIGDNTSGKTKKLTEIAHSLPADKLVTNLSGFTREDCGLHPARVWLMSMWAPSPMSVGEHSVIINEVPDVVNDILTRILQYGDYLVFDEPDIDVPDRWSEFVYEALFSVLNTFKESWIASHNFAITVYGDSDFYDCTKDRYVSREEAIEILDTF